MKFDVGDIVAINRNGEIAQGPITAIRIENNVVADYWFDVIDDPVLEKHMTLLEQASPSGIVLIPKYAIGAWIRFTHDLYPEEHVHKVNRIEVFMQKENPEIRYYSKTFNDWATEDRIIGEMKMKRKK